MSVTVVSGVPGVGASKVCEEARRELGDQYTLINTGDVMLEFALERNLATDRGELGELALAEQRVLQRRAGEYIERAAREAPVIANTHLIVRTARGFVPGLPEPVLSDVDPETIVLVEADAGTIVERRRRSESRGYPEGGGTAVEFHQQLSRAAAMWCSARSGAPIRAVHNEGSLEAATDALVAAIEGAGAGD